MARLPLLFAFVVIAVAMFLSSDTKAETRVHSYSIPTVAEEVRPSFQVCTSTADSGRSCC